jgi:Activator of Hsp90 ATPase homolog 1-like protein/Domain of unknown function (DUF6431)
MPEVAPMLIVCAEVALVEVELVGGLLACPSCPGVLGPWGHARERVLRCRSGDCWLRPRRARCRGCAGTHVLLPDVCLLRRQDEVSVIGAAIVAGGKASEGTDTFEGRFLELIPDEKIVEVIEFESQDPRFAGEMNMTTTFADADDGTEITVRCEDIPAGIRPEDNEEVSPRSLPTLVRARRMADSAI